jgi:hypothetical protein
MGMHLFMYCVFGRSQTVLSPLSGQVREWPPTWLQIRSGHSHFQPHLNLFIDLISSIQATFLLDMYGVSSGYSDVARWSNR